MIVKKKLGELLIEGKLLTEAQLEKALVDARKAEMKLGQFLMQSGIVNEMQIVDLLCHQLRIKRYLPEEYPIDVDLVNSIPYETAQKYQVAPLIRKGRLLIVAMTDPTDIYAMDNLEAMTNCELEPVVSTVMEMNTLHKNLYIGQTGLESLMGSFEDGPELDYKAEDQETDDVQVDTAKSDGCPDPLRYPADELNFCQCSAGTGQRHPYQSPAGRTPGTVQDRREASKHACSAESDVPSHGGPHKDPGKNGHHPIPAAAGRTLYH